MRTFFLALLFAILASTHANAAIFERDLLEQGDGLLTYDDVNRREWLDLPFTYKSNSFASIETLRETGGLLENFEFATKDDVIALHVSAGPTFYTSEGIDHLIDHVGFMFRGIGGLLRITESTYGLVAVNAHNDRPTFDGTAVSFENVGGALPPGTINRPSLGAANGRKLSITDAEERDANNWRLPDGYLILDNSLTLNTGPFWLYREAVPEPSTLGMSGVAFLAVLTTKSRRRRF